MQTNNKQNIDFSKAWSQLKPELDLEAKRREKKKRRFIFFWFTSAAVFVGSVFFVWNTGFNLKTKELALVKSQDAKESVTSQQMNSKLNSNQLKSIEKGNSAKTTNNDSKTRSNKVSLKSKNLESNLFNANSKNNNSKTNIHKPELNNTDTELQNKKAATINNNIYVENSITKIQSQYIEQKRDLNKNADTSTLINNNSVQEKNKEALDTKKTQQKISKKQKVEYGLQWNIPIVNAYNSLDANSNKNIAINIIPTLWVSKAISKKEKLFLFANPYSTYYSSNKAILSKRNYNTTTSQGNQLVPLQNEYTQLVALNKLIGVEAGLMLQHQVSSHIQANVGISGYFVQTALLQNKVTKNEKTITKDNIYSINKKDIEWNYLHQNFLLAKLELEYKFNKVNTGVNFEKPISNVFNNILENKTPINTNLFIRWKIK